MIVLRYFALFVLPGCFAVLMVLADPPDPVAVEKADTFIFAFFSEDKKQIDAIFSDMIKDTGEGLNAWGALQAKDAQRSVWLKYLPVFIIIGGFCLLAFVISLQAPAPSKANALTALAVGYSAANIMIGFKRLDFGFVPMDWPVFFQWAALGLIGAFLIVMFRSSRQRRPKQRRITQAT